MARKSAATAPPAPSPAETGAPPARYRLRVLVQRGSNGFYDAGKVVTAADLDGGEATIARWLALGFLDPVTTDKGEGGDGGH